MVNLIINQEAQLEKFRSGEIFGDYNLTPEDILSLGIRHDDRDTNLAAANSEILAETGARTDLGIKFLHAPLNEKGEKKNYEVYGLGQLTLDKDSNRTRNNRLGVGGEYDINDRVSLNAETTAGNGGWGGKVGAEYAASDRTSYYANYLMDTERSDIGYRGRNSNFTLGGKSRYSDSLSVFAENRYQSQDNGQSGLIHSFGLDLAASDKWTWGGRFENGTISDVGSGDIERTAVSLSTGYNADKTKYAGTAEVRLEDSETVGDRTSWLFKNNLSYQTTPDWRALGQFNIAISDSGLNGSLDADYMEVGLGYAYRPVLNDRLNALFKYTYLQDDPSPGQLNPTGSLSAGDYEQRSHVLTVDAIYDLTQKLSVGGKIGYRLSELKDTTIANSEWYNSQAFLLIGRVDWHVVKEWDVTGELRYLDVREAKDSKFGALVAGYKHINQNVKVGVGYNFTDFSDDLTDLDYKSKGPFINIIGKF